MIEEDLVPEIGETEDDEPEAKRGRLDSESAATPAPEEEAAEEGDEQQPQQKRSRTGSLSAVLDPTAREKAVSWADMMDADDLELNESRDFRRCDHCDGVFGSGNELHAHLRAVGRAPSKLKANHLGHLGKRSVRGWRPSTDDAARGSAGEDPLRGAHAKPMPRLESTYDFCEVFSPARTVPAAAKHGLRGGWSLDLAHTCAITGRRWNCLLEADRAWCKHMIYRDKPRMLIVSPPCTLFSALQHL